MTSQRFREIGTEIGDLVAEKDAAYGSAFAKVGQILDLLLPDGIPPGAGQMARIALLVRTLDKICREAQSIGSGAGDAYGESPWRDLAGYGVLGAAMAERQAGAATWSVEELAECLRRSADGSVEIRANGQEPSRCATLGCIRSPGHLDECLLKGERVQA